MGKYILPKVRLLRKFGLLPGITRKIEKKRQNSPGQHGKPFFFISKEKKFLSENFKDKLLEKQKLRYNYGITEKQLYQYYLYSRKKKSANTKSVLILLESRLDTLVFRIGFASTIPFARQMINHGHILVNNKKISIPSFLCRKKDIISLTNKEKTKKLIIPLLNTCLEKREKTIERNKEILSMKCKLLNKLGLDKIVARKLSKTRSKTLLPTYLDLNLKDISAKLVSHVNSKEAHIIIKERKIIEFYSK